VKPWSKSYWLGPWVLNIGFRHVTFTILLPWILLPITSYIH